MIEAGFADHAIESAEAYRSIMMAMARPGRIAAFRPVLSPPAPLFATAAAVALTLCDHQTPLWLAPELRSRAAEAYLTFHTGAGLADSAGQAAFAFAAGGGSLAPLDGFAAGTHEYPDRSATLVVQVPELSEQGPVTLTGPGIKGSVTLGVAGVAPSFWRMMAANAARFPLGVDVIFVSPSQIACCPRSSLPVTSGTA